MTYDDIAAIFLAPLDAPIPEPDVPATPARRLRDSLEPIATQGWWSRAAGERLTELGVDFFPGLIGAVYEAGVAGTGRDEILAARAAGGAASVGSVAGDDECAALAEPLLDALGGLDALGRPLFAALRSLPTPTSPSGRLWRAAELVREHRGDSHLAALVGAGLDAVEANVLTERWLGFGLGEYSATRGFGPDALAAAVERLEARGWMEGHELTDAGRRARVAIEEATDAGQAPLISALGSRLDDVVDGAAQVSARLIAARSFPADPRKRAGG